MKKIIYLLLVLPFLAFLGSCDDKDDIIFEHERPQFAIKDNAILLEIIMPQGSLLDDEYYITGPFNGGEEAIGNPTWQLEKAQDSNLKWGIYLIPSDFQSGKTLADGFTFYSKRQGAERSVKNEEVTHTLDVSVGTRTNVWLDRWENYFGEVDKKSYSVYVIDNTGWDEIALYVWHGDGPIGPDWPGFTPVGTEDIDGTTYVVFDLGEELKDAYMNMIFNNNGNGKQFDGPQEHELNADLYLELTENGFEIIDPEGERYSGYRVYVDDQSGWDALTLYGWGGDGDVTPGWPGLLPVDTKEVNGVTYTYFEWGEELNGVTVNMIFNNNGDGQQFDAIQNFVIERDLYLQITGSGFKEIDPNAGPSTGQIIYVENNSGWETVSLHYWGEDVGTDWPGLSAAGNKDINGTDYLYFELPEELNGMFINTIFNNGGNGEQFDGPYIEINRDYYFRISDDSFEEVNPDDSGTSHTIYVEDNSGWDALALHYWGDGVTGTDWPGLQPTGTSEVNGVNYTCFELPASLNGKFINTIFNNGGNGIQFDGPYIEINRDYYFRITDEEHTEINN